MIVSHQHRFIFFKTRKTAGTSVEIALSKFCGPDDIITQVTDEDEELRKQAGGLPPQNTTFTWSMAARNSGWLRGTVKTVTGYKRNGFNNHFPAWHIKKVLPREIWNNYFKFTVERDPWDKELSRFHWDNATKLKEPITLEEYFARGRHKYSSNWPSYAIENRVVANFVCQFSRLKDDLKAVTDHLGLVELELPRAKGNYRKDKRHYSEVMTSEMIEQVAEVHAREIREFGYAPVQKVTSSSTDVA